MKRILMLGLGVSLFAFGAMAQERPAAPGRPDPEMMARMQREMAAYNAMPDTPGTGAYPAMKEEVPGLPDHTIYRPRDVSAFGTKRLPVVVWGNGGCQGDAAAQRLHLLELASHGYLVIANGTIQSGPGAPPRPEATPPAEGGPPQIPPPQTFARQMIEGIDWAVAENARAGSNLRGKIDTKAVAASGYSCGGVQALRVVSSDPRVRTAVIHNSGLFSENAPQLAEMDLKKSALDQIKVPLIYILGGPTDVAFQNGSDDYARISRVPVALAYLDTGHGGTFQQPNGGAAAQAAVAWLDWRLKGDRQAATWFLGSSCKLCTDAKWKYQSKNLK